MRFCPRCLSIYSGETARCAVDGDALVVQSTDPLLGSQVAEYVIRERIGLGATGAVYRVEAIGSDEPLAMKILYGDLASEEAVVVRFLASAESAAQIDHANVVAPLRYGRTDAGTCYLVMPFVRGRTLATELASRGALPAGRAASIAAQIARGLAAAHHHGCVHRDVKPSNVLLSVEAGQTHARLVDFGLVAVPSEHPNRFQLVGTPLYIAPEVARDPSRAGVSSDLYALGVVLYQMLAGRPPFEAETVVDVLMRHTLDLPPPLEAAGGLETMAIWLLEKDPSHRPETATFVAEEIEQLGITDTGVEEEDDDDTLLPRLAPPMPDYDEEEVVTDDLLPEAEMLIPIVNPRPGGDGSLGYEFLCGRFDLIAESIAACPALDTDARARYDTRLESLRERLAENDTPNAYVHLASQLAEITRDLTKLAG